MERPDLTPWPIVIPLFGALFAFLLPKRASIVALVTQLALAVGVAGLAGQILRSGPTRHSIGGWGAPLGIDLRADGLSVAMLAMTALVASISFFHARASFSPRRRSVWPLWLLLITGLNALYLSGDIFNIYVSFEIIGLAAVALAVSVPKGAALRAGLRYLFVGLLGSFAYLLGVVLLYSGFGTLELASLAATVTQAPVVWVSASVVTAGLCLKTALVPLHSWLPTAHAEAPAPVSALLSALVIKASYYVLLRFHFELWPPAVREASATLLGGLGAAAVLWGSWCALRAARIKMLIAYSTVAQVGYLFLVFPLAADGERTAWGAAVILVLAHALSKSAMFLAAGTILDARGHDRIAELGGLGRQFPVTAFAIGLAGVSLMGLPPSGGFMAKWMLLQASLSRGAWGWTVILAVGGLLAAGYVFRIVSLFFQGGETPNTEGTGTPRCQWPAMLLATLAIGLGFLGTLVLRFLEIAVPA